jgi:hypothetical protein
MPHYPAAAADSPLSLSLPLGDVEAMLQHDCDLGTRIEGMCSHIIIFWARF